MKIRKLKLWHKILLGILIFIVIVLFAAPRVARYYIVNNSHELTGRKVDIRKIRINYFSGTVRIKDLIMYEQDGKTDFVRLGNLLVNLDYWPFLKRELYIKKIRLDDFYAQVEQKGQWFNFSDLVAKPDSQMTEDETADTSVTDSMKFSFNNITISDSYVKYTDLLLEHTISLDDIDLHIPGFSFSSEATHLAVDFNFIQGGTLHSALDYNQADSIYAVNLRLDSLNLDIIEPYVKDAIGISDMKGYFSNDIYIRGSINHIMQIEMSGWNRIDMMDIHDKQNRSILSFDQLRIDTDTLLLHENEIRINEIALVNPYILFELIDTTNNWLAMVVPADSLTSDAVTEKEEIPVDTLAPDITEATGEEAVFVYSLDRLALENGRVDFKDLTLPREFAATIQNMYIKSKDISAGNEDIALTLSAEINQTAEIHTDLVINPVDMNNIDIDFSLQKFAIKDVEPYLYSYFGYPVESGFLNFTSNTSMSKGSMTSENKLYVRQFNLGKPDKKEAQYKLPLRMAVGVLTDKDGVIDLTVPVTSKGEETKISNLGKLILKTLGNLIVKAATSPADMLAGMYNVDAARLKMVKIGMFETTPDKSDMETLDILAGIMDDKPKLRLAFNYLIDQDLYFKRLATKMVTNEYLETKTDDEYMEGPKVPDSLLIGFITVKSDVVQTDTGKAVPDIYVDYIGKERLAARLDSTRRVHIDFVHDYILSHKSLSDERLSITAASPDSVPDRNIEPETGENGIFLIRFEPVRTD